MFTSGDITEFAQALADHRPDQVFSVLGVHPVSYTETTHGEAAMVEVTMPEGMSVVLDNNSFGRITQVCIMLPKGDGNE